MRVDVDWRSALAMVGRVLTYLGVPLAVPLLVALYYGEPAWPFVTTILVTAAAGMALSRLRGEPELGTREGFLMVSVTWLFVSVIGALPYVLAGIGTASTLAMPVNALFESMSGFTTTGATVMGKISTERHSRAILLWRQLTQWLGGMGIVVLAVAILPELSVGGAQLMDAEAPGPGLEKLTPRITETARSLWLVYFGVTAIEVILLYGLNVAGFAPNMTAYNAVAHGFTTLSTGGFSPEARSIEAFSAAVQWLIIPFMVLAGTNFALIWHVSRGELGALIEDAEFRVYVGILGVVTALLTGLLFSGLGVEAAIPNTEPVVGGIEPALRHAAFQAAAIVTTTGYASLDFNAWSPIAQTVLFIAIFIGGSAGSTGGAIKIVRWYVIVKSLGRELFTTVTPSAVRPVRLGGRALDEDAVRGIHAFTLLYMLLFGLGVLVVMLDSTRLARDLSTFEVASAVAATIGNVGPGFGIVGPMNSYEPFTRTSKLVMIVLMWAGRLELFPVGVLLTRAYWRR
ncbi:MAG: TrkH family potassium uptake protein [Halobacteriaceae archaeon]